MDRLLQLSGAMKAAMQSSLRPMGWDGITCTHFQLQLGKQPLISHKLFSNPLPGPASGRELHLGTFLAVLAKEASRTLAGV